MSSWTCAKCTFFHHAPGTRCAMCMELRVTKTQMRNFIQGKGIHGERRGKQDEASGTGVAAPPAPALPGGDASQRKPPSPPRPPSSAKSITHNPVAVRHPWSSAGQQSYAAPFSECNNGESASNHTSYTIRKELDPPVPNQATSIRGTASAAGHQPPAQEIAASSRTNDASNSTVGPTLAHLAASASSTIQRRESLHSTTTSNNTTAAAAAAPATAPRAVRTSPFAPPPPPMPRVVAIYQPGPVPLAAHLAHEWIYPRSESFPKRQYQVELAQSAILCNTLVSLPTGLGKTLIAAVVLYNYYRLFPTGKVLFLAPTLPLVTQQVRACYEIMGIPAADTAVLTGRLAAHQRHQIWHDKRVFFCTPQTVQNDLETDRCPAQQIVCVVLDEAHKATGDYSYVKVIELVEKAGAKFRILGLSATPGTTIKAIQNVVETLRIHKVEARHDNDPNVAQYIHERHNEIVLVSQASASKHIERILNDMIGPLLDRIRQQSGALRNLAGYNTVTAYNVIRARDEYVRRPDYMSALVPYFCAAWQMVQLRSDLHQHGVGVVRTKVQRMLNEPQKGVLATIVKSAVFGALWTQIQAATCDPNAPAASVQDRLMNNPKMSKLLEILQEHFARAKQAGTSSRAIVFSQMRDSVSEIVTVLGTQQPLIRPRHFVGQGKGGGSKGDVSESGATKVKGMKQAEQQEVVRQFRDDFYNVLVCTCIGEEGLDIGEVDLIVNFDTLRSPIRMIQRVGRTGRKRIGRVVCLVAEGLEERTLRSSQQAERTLVHALKDPKSFKVASVVPLFPSDPVLREQNMNVDERFRMSQVEGHGGGGARRKQNVTAEFEEILGICKTYSTRWKLNDVEESRRRVVLGDIDRQIVGERNVDIKALRRRLLIGQEHSLSRQKSDAILAMGRSARLYLAWQQSQSSAIDNVSAMPPRTRQRARQSAIEVLFPLHKRVDARQITVDAKLPDLGNTCESEVGHSLKRDHALQSVAVTDASLQQDGASLAITGDPHVDSEREPVLRHDTMECDESSSNSANEACSTTLASTHEGAANDLPSTGCRSVPPAHHGDVTMDDFCLPSQIDDSSDSETEPLQASHEHDFRNALDAEPATTDFDEFVLPSQDSDDDDSEQDVVNDTARSNSCGGTRTDGDYPPSHDNVCANISAGGLASIDDFVLPSQDALSDEEDDCGCNNLTLEKVNSLQAATTTSGGAESEDEEPVNDDFGSEEGENLGAVAAGRRKANDATSSHTPAKMSSLVSAALPSSDRRSVAFDLTNTQSSQRTTFPDKCHRSSLASDLSNTQDSKQQSTPDLGRWRNADGIVCEVCRDGTDSDDNQLVVCDGCDMPLHEQCYEMKLTVEQHGAAPWYCERCLARRQDGIVHNKQSMICADCGGNKGALKMVRNGSAWQHVGHCPASSKRPPGKLKRLGQRLQKKTKKRQHITTMSTTVAAQQQQRRAQGAAAFPAEAMAFVDREALLDSDEEDDDSDDDSAANAIEQDEARYDSFINDSTQLGVYTQDELDEAEEWLDEGHVHRAYDQERRRQSHLATPVLNRRMQWQSQDEWNDNDTGRRRSSSTTGLGNMNFIRSVLEHCRQGGRAEDIEQFYQEMEKEEQSRRQRR